MRPQPTLEDGVWRWKPRKGWDVNVEHVNRSMCPYWSDEETLWVKENFRLGDFWDCIPKGAWIEGQKAAGNPVPTVRYEADERLNHIPISTNWKPGKLHPSIFMPHWAHRIDLGLDYVWIEQVQHISASDCVCEGAVSWQPDGCDAAGEVRDGFHILWDSINLKRGFGWDANPWVWCLRFSLASTDHGLRSNPKS